ncbi:hypothetical protein BCR36DRAFT_147787 [Piromyces finnis]|uniref:Uncharacterized protein n=1 Tax=Piromyces finnis TaxID=1754191 RepID=A0A1Y1UXX1_9FUNG|nr:hypothetical protein BCR36DRAFT_147787 [Piromyces finnis]|eukprot:ORX43053.1 hypothetical protein BCR36DRAFT_147787 [Piromyces finnis]
MSDENKYISISVNKDEELNYPDQFKLTENNNNNNDIIIEVGKYYAKQYQGTTCIDSDTSKKELPCKVGSIIYNCSILTETCTTNEVRGCEPSNKNPIARSNCKEGYYLVNKSLYECSNNKITNNVDCNLQSNIGYFVNVNVTDSYIKCTESGVNISCESKSIEDSCTSAGILIKDKLNETQVKLCPDTDDNKAFNVFKTNNGNNYNKYFLKAKLLKTDISEKKYY